MRISFVLRVLILAFMLLPVQAQAEDPPVLPGAAPEAPAPAPVVYPADVTGIYNAYAFATSPLQQNGGVFMDVVSPVDDRIVAAVSPRAERVELHVSDMSTGFMQMRPVDAFDIKAGEVFKLDPKGAHLMLINLKDKLREGSKLPLTITFEKAGPVQIEATIVTPGTTPVTPPVATPAITPTATPATAPVQSAP